MNCNSFWDFVYETLVIHPWNSIHKSSWVVYSFIEIHEWYLMDVHLQFLECMIFFGSTLFHCEISWNFYSLSIHSSIKFYPPQFFWMKVHPLEFSCTLNELLHAQIFVWIILHEQNYFHLETSWKFMKVHLMDSFYIRKKVHPIGSFRIPQNSCHCT